MTYEEMFTAIRDELSSVQRFMDADRTGRKLYVLALDCARQAEELCNGLRAKIEEEYEHELR